MVTKAKSLALIRTIIQLDLKYFVMAAVKFILLFHCYLVWFGFILHMIIQIKSLKSLSEVCVEWNTHSLNFHSVVKNTATENAKQTFVKCMKESEKSIIIFFFVLHTLTAYILKTQKNKTNKKAACNPKHIGMFSSLPTAGSIQGSNHFLTTMNRAIVPHSDALGLDLHKCSKHCICENTL